MILECIVFFGSFGLFAIGFALGGLVISEFICHNELVAIFAYFGGAVIGVAVWLGVMPSIFNWLFN